MSVRTGLGERLAALRAAEPGHHAPQPTLTVRDHVLRIGAVALLGLVLFAASYASMGLIEDPEYRAEFERIRAVDAVLGVVTVPLLIWRRRWPVAVALATAAAMPFSSFAMVAYLYTLVSLATRRRIVPILVVLGLLPVVSWVGQYVMDHWVVPTEIGVSADPLGFLSTQVMLILASLVFVLLGWNMGARRELAWSAEQQARIAEREHTARLAQARLSERAAIAREMHDALGHRLSVVSMHAGALAYRQDLSADQMRDASSTIAKQAKTALEDLREILGVLRSTETPESPVPLVDAGGPLPAHSSPAEGHRVSDLRRLPALVAEASGYGSTIDLQVPDPVWEQASKALPSATSRHAFRVVQEAVTNAVKHAPGQPVLIELGGAPGRGLTLRVVNPLPGPGEAPRDVVSGGLGLAGMTERIELARGQLSAGEQDGEFVVQAWLPWPRRAPEGSLA